MKWCKKQQNRIARLLWVALAGLLLGVCGAWAVEEQTFRVLQIGTHVYTNVTVTTKAKDYIFILHSSGMNSIKVANLPDEVREKLGYSSLAKTNASSKTPVGWAKAEVTKLETPQIKQMRQNLAQKWPVDKAGLPLLKALLGTRLFLALAATLVLLYLLRCYCFLLICRKAGHPPGPLVWIPVLQMFPLLRAAGMSAWWFAAWLLPLLNLVAFILWSVNITKARGKSGWVALFLILPPTNFLATLYLAFADGGEARPEGDEPEVMTLQTA